MRQFSSSQERSESSSPSSFARWITRRHVSPFGVHVTALSVLFAILTVQMAPLAEGDTLLALLLLLCLVLLHERRALSLAWLLAGCAALCLWGFLRPELAPLLFVFVYAFAWNGALLLAPIPGALGVAISTTHTFADRKSVV